jgi:phage terminase small subunit
MTEKEEKFCYEYLKDYNATKSAIRAGYSEKSAYSIGSENLKKPELLEKITELKNKLSEVSELTALSVVLRLKSIIESETEKTSDRLKAIEVSAKLLGFNEPEKQIVQFAQLPDIPLTVK